MKDLTNYGNIMKLFYRMQSIKNLFAIPAKIRWAAITKTMNPSSTVDMESFQKQASKPLSIPFYQFNSPALFYDWGILIDQEAGGESVASLSFNPEQQYAEFKGQLIEERNNLLQQRMYAGLSCLFISRLSLRNYNGIRMKIKTDGNLYKMLISCNSDFDTFHDAYAFTIDRSCEWQTVEIPFARFLVEKLKGQDSSKFMEYFLDKFIVKGLSLVIESEKETSFCLQIKSIDMIYREDFSSVLESYRRPFFFVMQENYKNIQKLDLGDQVLSLRKDINQQSRTVSVNECINPKELEEFTSFKDRLKKRQEKKP